MSPTARRAGLLAFALIACAVVAWNLVPQSPAPSAPSYPQPNLYSPQPAEASPSVAAIAASPPIEPVGATREYAIALPELQGLPPDAAPGTRLELWVTWNPPVTRRPKLQRLLADATLVRFAPAVTHDGPGSVILQVPVRRMSDLLYADEYGALSATVL